MASTSISGWSGAGGRKFTLEVTTSNVDAWNTNVSMKVSISGESSWMTSHMNVYAYDTSTPSSVYTYINQTAAWDSGVWFTRAGNSQTYTGKWSRLSNKSRTIRVYIKGYAVEYSDRSNYVDVTIPVEGTEPTVTAGTPYDIGTTSFKIKATSNVDCKQWAYRTKKVGGSYSDWKGWYNVSGKSYTFNISGLALNTNYVVQLAGLKSTNNVWGWSNEPSFKTLGYSTITSVTDAVLGEAPAINWTPLDSTFTFKLTFSLGNWNYTTESISPGSTAAYTYSSYQIPMEVCGQLTNVTSGSMKVVLTTYNGQTAIGTSEKTFTVSVPDSVIPGYESFTVSDIGQNIFGVYVQNKSIIRFDLETEGAYGSTVNSAALVMDEQRVTVPVVNNVASITTEVLAMSGTRTADITITDSRDRTNTETRAIEVYPYHVPAVTGISLDVQPPNVSCSFSYDISAVDGTNIRYIQIDRIRSYDQERTTVIDREELTNYSGTFSFTDSVEDIDIRNYTYQILIEDSYGVVTYSRQVRPGAGDRFGELHNDEFFVGVDKEGFKIPNEGITGGIDNGVITFNRTSGDTPAGIGVPVPLEPNTTYELIYATNVISDETVVCVSYFDSEFNYISTYDADYLIEPGEKFTTAAGTGWGLFLFGSAPSDYSISDVAYRVFSGIAVRKVNDPEQEEIEWMVETGNLGLDTPNQKYVSRIQLRIEFAGTLRIGISYDNDKPFELVHSSVSDHMRSITVPINVKRCDHFRLRMRGIGQAKLYSMGYYTEDGSARCLI